MTATIVLTALICLLIGIAVGSLLTRTLSPQEKQRRELEEKLRRTEDRFKIYQQDVTDHFVRTSELVSNLTQSYRDVHEHLATSAMHLANPEVSRQLLDAGAGGLGRSQSPHPHTLPHEAPEPPKDYAPKVPGGVLSEDFGFRDTPGLHPEVPQGANDPVNTSDEGEEDPTLKVG